MDNYNHACSFVYLAVCLLKFSSSSAIKTDTAQVSLHS